VTNSTGRSLFSNRVFSLIRDSETLCCGFLLCSVCFAEKVGVNKKRGNRWNVTASAELQKFGVNFIPGLPQDPEIGEILQYQGMRKLSGKLGQCWGKTPNGIEMPGENEALWEQEGPRFFKIGNGYYWPLESIKGNTIKKGVGEIREMPGNLKIGVLWQPCTRIPKFKRCQRNFIEKVLLCFLSEQK